MEPVEVVKAFVEAFSGFDEEAALALVEPNVVQHSTIASEPVVGQEQVRAFIRALQAVVESVDDVSLELIGTGPYVAVAGNSRGRTITSDSVTLKSLTVFEVGDTGKIRSIWGFGHPIVKLEAAQTRP
jgi:limonene-1,2-epoxide hydrolase